MTVPNARRGSALLEVLIAGAILLAGLTAIVSVLPTPMKLISTLHDLAQADRVAAATVEQLVMTWATDPTRVPRTGSKQVDDAGRTDPQGMFNVSWTLASDRPVAGYTLITAAARWQTIDGIPHTRVLRTYVTGVTP